MAAFAPQPDRQEAADADEDEGGAGCAVAGVALVEDWVGGFGEEVEGGDAWCGVDAEGDVVVGDV